MPEVTFQGSRHEVGRLHGAAFSVAIRRELQLALTLHGGKESSDPAQLFARTKAFAPWMRRHLPGYLAEVEGLAEGAGLSVDAALFLAVSDGLQPHPNGDCTSFYCGPESSRDGSVFLGQTKDTPPRDGRYFVMRFRYDDGPEMLLLNYAGWLANIGMTSYGVALCGNALYANTQTPDCLPFALLKRAILESPDVARARQFVESGLWQDGCLGLADRSGRGVFIELILGRPHYLEMTGEARGHANSILTPEHRNLDCSASASPCSSTRQQTVDRILQAPSGSITDETLRNLAANHENAPHSICRHPRTPEGTRTTAALVANVSEGWMDVALGLPCSTPFQRHFLNHDPANR